LTLLDNKIVDFVGSDAHRIDHRPPAVAKGIEYLYANYDEEYVDNILYNNAMDLILCEAENEEDVESNIWIDGVMGVITGDALGMPVQFLSREDVQDGPIITMDGYGTYGMPAGTWSDDGSMTIATLDSIRERSGIDYDDIMCRFIGWTSKGEYTPAGIAFDQGNSCMEAIGNYAVSQDYRTCGKTGEWANGNGALMRIMPVCLYSYVQYKNGKVTLEELTHLKRWLLRNTSLKGSYPYDKILKITNVRTKSPTIITRINASIDYFLKTLYMTKTFKSIGIALRGC
jgi:hypothetical protein